MSTTPDTHALMRQAIRAASIAMLFLKAEGLATEPLVRCLAQVVEEGDVLGAARETVHQGTEATLVGALALDAAGLEQRLSDILQETDEPTRRRASLLVVAAVTMRLEQTLGGGDNG